MSVDMVILGDGILTTQVAEERLLIRLNGRAIQSLGPEVNSDRMRLILPVDGSECRITIMYDVVFSPVWQDSAP
jgi:hypothetical protein